MRFNCSFTTYRRGASGSKRQYSGSATITAGAGFYEPTGGDLRAILGLDLAVKAYTLLTHESDLQIGDKVVIGSDTYYIESVEKLSNAPITLSRAVIIIKEL